MKSHKKTILFTSLLSLFIIFSSIFFLQQNALDSDTARLHAELDKISLSQNPLTATTDSVKILPKDSQDPAITAIKDGAIYFREVQAGKLTLTQAIYKNSQIQGFLSLTAPSSSITMPLSLMIAIVLIFYVLSLNLILKSKREKQTEQQSPLLNPEKADISYEFIELFQFPIFIFDDRGKILQGNSAFKHQFPSVLTIDQFSLNIEFLNFLLKNMLNPITHKDSEFIHFDVEPITDYEVQFLPLMDSNENDNRFMVTLNDVTAYRDALKAQKELVANVSHELKTPLTSIRGFAELLENSQDISTEKRQEFAKVISTESERLLSLVSDIILLSKPQSQLESNDNVNLKSLIEQILNNFQTQIKNKKLEIKLDLAEFSFLSKEKLLQPIFKNLIENAIFYSNLNGTIKLELKESNNQVNFMISNTGSGLNEIEKTRIFERFYRTSSAGQFNPKGTGLGLAIVEKNLHELGGRITVDSKIGHETTFHLTLKKL